MAAKSVSSADAPRWFDVFEGSDEEVLQQVLDGEHHLFEVLMRRNNERLFRAVRSILRNEGEVEEIMQEAYVNAYANLARFEGRSKFSTWLLQIGINAARRRLKTQARTVPELPTDTPSQEPDPERAAAAKELGALVERSVDELAPNSRTVFMLRDVEGLDTSEIAQLLDLSKEAVRVRLHRARSALRDRLSRDLGPVTPCVFRFYRPRCNRVVEGVFGKIASTRTSRAGQTRSTGMS